MIFEWRCRRTSLIFHPRSLPQIRVYSWVSYESILGKKKKKQSICIIALIHHGVVYPVGDKIRIVSKIVKRSSCFKFTLFLTIFPRYSLKKLIKVNSKLSFDRVLFLREIKEYWWARNTYQATRVSLVTEVVHDVFVKSTFLFLAYRWRNWGLESLSKLEYRKNVYCHGCILQTPCFLFWFPREKDVSAFQLFGIPMAGSH